MQITVADLKRLCPTAKPHIVEGIVAHQHLLDEFEVNTPLRVTHFIAQIAHESAHFRTTREFASGKAYEGRDDLGNTEPGDGERFRGRGLIQITGRYNAREAGRDLGKPYEDQPELMEKFPDALLVSLWFWRRRKLNRFADADDIVGATKVINGGTNGLTDRKKYLKKAKAIWGDSSTMTDDDDDDVVSLAGMPTLRKGSRNRRGVATLQRELVEAGYRVDVDGVFGTLTEAAVEDFQEREGLTADGVVGKRTWQALEGDRGEKARLPGAIPIIDREPLRERENVQRAPRRPTEDYIDVQGVDGRRMRVDPNSIRRADPGDPELIAAVQEKLRELRYFQVGRVDGIHGDNTTDAIKAFQRRNNLSETGEIDDLLLKHLFIPGNAKEKCVSDERAMATRDDVADSPILRRTEAAKRKTWIAWLLSLFGFPTAFGAGAGEEATDPRAVTDAIETNMGFLERVGYFAADNWVMFVIFALVLAGVAWYLYQAQQDIDDAEEEEVQAYREGRHM